MDDITVRDIASLVIEARSNPNSERVVAMRLALEEIDRQAQDRRDHIEVSQAMSGGADWAAVANNHVEHDELERRRAEPGPPLLSDTDPDLRLAFDRAEEEQARQEAWRRDDEDAAAVQEDQALAR